MFDSKISLPRINTLHPFLRQEVIQIFEEIEKNGVIIRCVYGTRTFQEQNNLYQQGRTIPGNIVTWATPGFSFHQYGLAVDCCLLRNGDMWSTKVDDDADGISDWIEMVTTFEKYGWNSGYRWPKPKFDGPHFEKTFGYDIQTLYDMHLKNEYGTNGYLNIKYPQVSPRGYGGTQ